MAIIKDYLRAKSTTEAVQMLLDRQPARILAGGTDLLAANQALLKSYTVVDVSDIPELTFIEASQEGIRIGSATKLADIAQSGLLTGALHCLVEGAVQIGSVQIRNLATLGGNLCNASPSADTAAPLLVLDARVEIVSTLGKRSLPVADFLLGPGKTALEPGELVEAILLPYPPPGAEAIYLKHAVRGAMDLAIVGVAAYVERLQKHHRVRIGLAAVAPTPIRATMAEEFLEKADVIDEKAIEEAAALAAGQASPISDVRASAEYRKAMIRSLTRRGLRQTLARLG